jgi:Polyketide cyclase / dehydrase and lipid transport
MGKKLEIDERAWTAADPDTVYGLLAKGATWPVWSPIGSFELQQEGEGEPEGLNAVRIFRTGRTTSVERLVELRPGRRLSYALLDGLPLVDYRADVDLEPSDDGTSIRWHSTFVPKRRGTGWLYRFVLAKFIRRCVHGLASHAASVEHAPQTR